MARLTTKNYFAAASPTNFLPAGSRGPVRGRRLATKERCRSTTVTHNQLQFSVYYNNLFYLEN